MKKRKSVTVIGILATVFAVITLAFLVVGFVTYNSAGSVCPSFGLWHKLIADSYQVFISGSEYYNALAYACLGVVAILLVIWLIFTIKRKRFVSFLFMALLAVVGYLEVAFGVMCNPEYLKTIEVVTKSGEFLSMLPLIGFVLADISCGLVAALFVVDMATGKRSKLSADAEYDYAYEEPKAAEVSETKADEAVVAAPVSEEVAKESAQPLPEAKEEPAKKEAVKKEPAKKEAAKKAEPAKKEAAKKAPAKKAPIKKEEETNFTAKQYHISRRADINKWQVKAAKGEKATKLFDTQKEAIEYAKTLAGNQDASIRVHSRAGKIRKE